MGKRGQKQNRFLRIITMPLKVLCKARDLYMRSITGCAARTHYSSAVDAASVPFPRSRSTSSAFSSSAASSRRRSSDYTFDDDYSELLRAASARSLGHKNEIDMIIHQQLQQQQLRQKQQLENRVAVGAVAVAVTGKGGLPKSSSVGITMARIDEEEEEEEGSFKKGSEILLYPRSRSHAVTIRGSKF
ncbi:hypothetical protein CARUB_v10021366mg [Capsella rubella]|uniref:Uncharacterized protein n=1 Tax=Capsella rubella TaxID=81985 RepID=R0HVK1_9BRAS|nr:uncharacterized protein LOC17895327 [Capsella rubella]EOA33874.1 hypothetical protein CARUB_v10021366mg [Capsella rubella]